MSEYSIRRVEDLDALREIQVDWDRLYLANPRLTHFQSFAWNYGMLSRGALRGALRVYCLYRGSRLVLIAPLMAVRRGFRPEIVFVGHDTHADYLDFIYDELQAEDIDFLVRRITKEAGVRLVTFAFMNQDSRAAVLLGELGRERARVADLCFSIRLPESEEDYLAQLGKSTRKEIHAAANRFDRECADHRFDFRIRDQLDRDLVRELIHLYRERLALKKLRFRFSEEYVEFLVDYIADSRDVFLAALYLQGRLAAFNLGFVGRRQDIQVLLVSIDSQHKRLNIGNLLLYRTVCHLIAARRDTGLDIGTYDLTRGDELYKKKYGGVPHDILRFTYSRHAFVYTAFKLVTDLRRAAGRLLRYRPGTSAE